MTTARKKARKFVSPYSYVVNAQARLALAFLRFIQVSVLSKQFSNGTLGLIFLVNRPALVCGQVSGCFTRSCAWRTAMNRTSKGYTLSTVRCPAISPSQSQKQTAKANPPVATVTTSQVGFVSMLCCVWLDSTQTANRDPHTFILPLLFRTHKWTPKILPSQE